MAIPALASYYAEEVFGVKDLSVEEAQFAILMRRELNQWEQFYIWHRDGEINSGDWEDWNAYYSEYLTRHFPQAWWNGIKIYCYPEFSLHVDSIYDE